MTEIYCEPFMVRFWTSQDFVPGSEIYPMSVEPLLIRLASETRLICFLGMVNIQLA